MFHVLAFVFGLTCTFHGMLYQSLSAALCSPNTYSANGFLPCQSCDTRYYQPLFGSTLCFACPQDSNNKQCSKTVVEMSSIGNCWKLSFIIHSFIPLFLFSLSGCYLAINLSYHKCIIGKRKIASLQCTIHSEHL